VLRLVLGNRKGAIGCALLAAIVVLAICAPLLTSYDPQAMSALPSQPPSAAHPFGTNHQGQDLFAQVLYGARFTLTLGFLTGTAIIVLCITVGMTAGYFGGWIDDVLSLLMNVFLVLPALPFMIVLAAYVQTRGAGLMIFVVTLTGWAWGGRVLRSQTLSLRNKDFVHAAVTSGEATWRIIFREILPNMISLTMSSYIGAIMVAILAEVGLEFLGLGDVKTTSWGMTLYWARNNSVLMTGEWWHFLFPGLAIAVTGVALILINFGIDEVSNPRLHVATGPRIRARKSASAAAAAAPVAVAPER
jgi:peptide/nickel transport system permease protein